MDNLQTTPLKLLLLILCALTVVVKEIFEYIETMRDLCCFLLCRTFPVFEKV